MTSLTSVTDSDKNKDKHVVIIQYDIYQHDEEESTRLTEAGEYYNIFDSRKYDLNNFPLHDQTLILAQIDEDIRFFIGICETISDSKSNSNYAKDKINGAIIRREVSKVYFEFIDCDPGQINDCMMHETYAGWFSSYRPINLSVGGFALMPQWCPWNLETDDFEIKRTESTIIKS
jgi:hypothetical protein